MREGQKFDNNINVQISHQTGAQLMALPFQTTELTNWTRQARPDHAM